MNKIEDEFKLWLKTPRGTLILNRSFGHDLTLFVDGHIRLNAVNIFSEFEKYCKFKRYEIKNVEGKSGEFRAKIRTKEGESFVDIKISI